MTALPGKITLIRVDIDKPGRLNWHYHILSHEEVSTGTETKGASGQSTKLSLLPMFNKDHEMMGISTGTYMTSKGSINALCLAPGACVVSSFVSLNERIYLCRILLFVLPSAVCSR